MPLSGKIALVTGATSGIGFYTAREIARLGGTAYITARDARSGAAAVEKIYATTRGEARFIQTGLSAVGANQELAEQIATEVDRLDILVNNVGGVYHSRWQTAGYYESTLGIQLAGPAALTAALLPLLERGAPARIVNVLPAAVPMWHDADLPDAAGLGEYLGTDPAARTKFAAILWTFALARRLEAKGVTVNVVDPGTAWTALTARVNRRELPAGAGRLWSLYRVIEHWTTAKSSAQATIFMATSPAAAEMNGEYVDKHCRPVQPPRVLLDVARQERGWAETQRLIREAPTALTRGKVLV